MDLGRYDLRDQIRVLPLGHRLAGLMLVVVSLIFGGVLIKTESELVQIILVAAITLLAVVFFLLFFLAKPKTDLPPIIDHKVEIERDFSDEAKKLYEEGIKYRDGGKTLNALRAFNSANAKAENRHWKARFNAAQCYQKMNRPNMALRELDSLIADLSLLPNREKGESFILTHSFIKKAIILDERGNADSAYEILCEGREQAEKPDAHLHINLFISAAKLNKIADAKKWYEACPKEDLGKLLSNSLTEKELAMLSKLPWFKQKHVTETENYDEKDS